MENLYYYNKNRDKVGPITVIELKTLAQQGMITPETIIENEGGKSLPAGKVKGLTFPETTSSPAQNPFSTTHPPVVQATQTASAAYPPAKVKRFFPLVGSELWIKVGRKYSTEELLELMQQNFEDKYGPFEIKRRLIKQIVVNGVNGDTISITPCRFLMFGYSIVIRHEKKIKWEAPPHTLSGCIFGLILGILNVLTLGIAHWHFWDIRKNWHIIKPLSEDIAKIVQG